MNFDLISVLFCYNVTVRSIEIPSNHSGFTNNGFDPKTELLGRIIHQSMHN